MYTVYMKGNSNIFYSGFSTWTEARSYGRQMFGPSGYEIVQE